MTKTIKIEVPNGKRAEWVNNVLTLVEDKPKDVTERINKLDAFIEHNPKFAELGQDDRDMLRSQYEAMRIYEHILIDRITKAQQ